MTKFFVKDHPCGISSGATNTREHAIDELEQHGLRAHYYMPAIGMDNQELANACRKLASAGYIITDDDGCIVGKVATARPSKEEIAMAWRSTSKLPNETTKWQRKKLLGLGS